MIDEKARVRRALTEYFFEHTGFSVIGTDEDKPTVSASYGGHWVDLRIDRMADAVLQALSPGSDGWQPIETAPKDGTKILIWGYFQNPLMTFLTWEELGAPEVSYFCNGVWNGPLAGAHDEYITYQPVVWQPLPAISSAMLAAAGGREG